MAIKSFLLIAILFCGALAQSTTSLGCFADDAARVLNGTSADFGSRNTPVYCQSWCATSGYKYSGVQYSTQCFCGNEYNTLGALPASDCNMPCGGDASKTCGGAYANNVYETGYLGCYADKAGASDLTYNLNYPVGWTMFPDSCRVTCGLFGFAYAGVENGTECSCSNSYGKYGASAQSNCNVKCQGDAVFNCGGDLFNAVFDAISNPYVEGFDFSK